MTAHFVQDVWRRASVKSKRRLYGFFSGDALDHYYEENTNLQGLVASYHTFTAQSKYIGCGTLSYSERVLLEATRAAWLKQMVSKLQETCCPEGEEPALDITPSMGSRAKQAGKKVVGGLARIVCVIALIGGVIKELSEVADSYTSTILPLLGGVVPGFILVAIAAVFVALALALYLAFEFTNIREKMGLVSEKRTRIDELVEQKSQVMQIEHLLPIYLLKVTQQKDSEALQTIQQMMAMLELQHEALAEEQAAYQKTLSSRSLKVTQYVLNGILSVMYAANGYFICQTGIPLIIAALNYLIPALALTAPVPWLMLTIALLGAVAGFIVFWCQEGEALSSFIANSRPFGYVDKKKAEALSDDDTKRSWRTIKRGIHEALDELGTDSPISEKPFSCSNASSSRLTSSRLGTFGGGSWGNDTSEPLLAAGSQF